MLKAPEASVRAIVEQKKTVAAMAVDRERKFALPVAPKTEPEAPHEHEHDHDDGRDDLQNESDAKKKMHGG